MYACVTSKDHTVYLRITATVIKIIIDSARAMEELWTTRCLFRSEGSWTPNHALWVGFGVHYTPNEIHLVDVFHRKYEPDVHHVSVSREKRSKNLKCATGCESFTFLEFGLPKCSIMAAEGTVLHLGQPSARNVKLSNRFNPYSEYCAVERHAVPGGPASRGSPWYSVSLHGTVHLFTG